MRNGRLSRMVRHQFRKLESFNGRAGSSLRTFRQDFMRFYKKIKCEHGWTDDRGFSCCNLGTGCSVGLKCYCTKEDCPIYEKDEEFKDGELAEWAIALVLKTKEGGNILREFKSHTRRHF